MPPLRGIVHAAGVTKLKIRYLNISRDNELPDTLFIPDWPAGTTIVRN